MKGTLPKAVKEARALKGPCLLRFIQMLYITVKYMEPGSALAQFTARDGKYKKPFPPDHYRDQNPFNEAEAIRLPKSCKRRSTESNPLL